DRVKRWFDDPRQGSVRKTDAGGWPYLLDTIGNLLDAALAAAPAETPAEPPAAPVQPEERGDAGDELDEALAGAMSALEWAANHISLARSCARAALGSTPDTGSTA